MRRMISQRHFGTGLKKRETVLLKICWWTFEGALDSLQKKKTWEFSASRYCFQLCRKSKIISTFSHFLAVRFLFKDKNCRNVVELSATTDFARRRIGLSRVWPYADGKCTPVEKKHFDTGASARHRLLAVTGFNDRWWNLMLKMSAHSLSTIS